MPPGYSQWFGLHGNSRYYNYTLNENGVLKDYGDAEEDYLTDVLVNIQKCSFIFKQTIAVIVVEKSHAQFPGGAICRKTVFRDDRATSAARSLHTGEATRECVRECEGSAYAELQHRFGGAEQALDRANARITFATEDHRHHRRLLSKAVASSLGCRRIG